jgi:Endonuclease NucS
MPKEVHLWRIESRVGLIEVPLGKLDLEDRLESWLAQDISVLDPDLLVIGRQVPTEGGPLDLLCIDDQGDLVIVELKRDKTPREITAQVLDYASTIVDLTDEQIRAIAAEYLSANFDEVFAHRFGADIPAALNGAHRMLVVGSAIDAASERIIKYLSDSHGININAATFQYFKLGDDSELLTRVFFIEPSEVDQNARNRGTSRRRNLTIAELNLLAQQAGLSDLYDYAVSMFGPPRLRRSTTLSSIRWDANLAGSRKVILSLIPGDSTTERGLHFQLYGTRYAELTNVPVEGVEALMPIDHQHWEYVVSGGPDWEGFEGFIRTSEDVDRIAEPIRSTDAVQ